MRYVICHYHIFKNSGTSFDTLLAKNYGNKHICFDGPFPFFQIDQQQLGRIIDRKKEIVAFSSHQIRLPVPVSLDFYVLPVVFIRHPLLRVQSIYKFKRNSNDGTLISKMAKKKTFDEWITSCFDDGHEVAHISNAQTAMIGGVSNQGALRRRSSVGLEYDIHQAMRNMQNVQFLARTEYFDNDVARFSEMFLKYGINFEYKKIKPQNTTSDNHDLPIEARIEQLEHSLSSVNIKKLWDVNAQDILMFSHASKMIEENHMCSVVENY